MRQNTSSQFLLLSSMSLLFVKYSLVYLALSQYSLSILLEVRRRQREQNKQKPSHKTKAGGGKQARITDRARAPHARSCSSRGLFAQEKHAHLGSIHSISWILYRRLTRGRSLVSFGTVFSSYCIIVMVLLSYFFCILGVLLLLLSIIQYYLVFLWHCHYLLLSMIY